VSIESEDVLTRCMCQVWAKDVWATTFLWDDHALGDTC